VLEEHVKSAEERMEKAVLSFKRDLGTVRTGRATAAMLDKITVDYYGSPMPINQVAGVSSPDPRQLVIAPWEKTMLIEIEKAIQKSDLGLNPSSDGVVIRLNIPVLTDERRHDLVKQVRKMAEESRVAIRNIRRDENDEAKKLEKTADVSADEVHRAVDKIQVLTDRFVSEIDKMMASKEKDLTEI